MANIHTVNLRLPTAAEYEHISTVREINWFFGPDSRISTAENLKVDFEAHATNSVNVSLRFLLFVVFVFVVVVVFTFILFQLLLFPFMCLFLGLAFDALAAVFKGFIHDLPVHCYFYK